MGGQTSGYFVFGGFSIENFCQKTSGKPQLALDYFSQGGWANERKNELKIRKNLIQSIYHSLFSHLTHPPVVQG